MTVCVVGGQPAVGGGPLFCLAARLTQAGREHQLHVVPRSWAPAVACLSLLTATAPPPAPSSALAANRAAAGAEAAHLLALLRLPTGAQPLRGVPKSSPLAGNWLPTEGAQLARTAFWSVPAGSPDPLGWVKAHPPKGLTLTGWGSGYGPGPGSATTTQMYDAPPSAVWVQAELRLTEAALGPTTDGVRADAVVYWLDPRPLPDNVPGHRVRVEAGSSCPSSDAGAVGVLNPPAGIRARLLPEGTPTAALVCIYGRYGATVALSPPGALAHQARLGPAAANRWVAAVDAVPLSHTDGVMYRCPLSLRTVVMAFAYPHRADVDIWAQPGGCPVVSNGYVLADRLGPSRLAELVAQYR